MLSDYELVDGWPYLRNFQFSMPQTTLEMATVERLLHIPEHSAPCKIRAKRGCATHPRSIAERVSLNFTCIARVMNFA